MVEEVSGKTEKTLTNPAFRTDWNLFESLLLGRDGRAVKRVFCRLAVLGS